MKTKKFFDPFACGQGFSESEVRARAATIFAQCQALGKIWPRMHPRLIAYCAGYRQAMESSQRRVSRVIRKAAKESGITLRLSALKHNIQNVSKPKPKPPKVKKRRISPEKFHEFLSSSPPYL
jgi:hypothetical protein